MTTVKVMFKQEKLTNGIDLILAPMKETQAVTVLILAPTGSRYETPKINGLAHFIEHLLFKGTAKRPTSWDLTRELDGVGADYNAFTAKDHTGYYIKVNREHLELALDLLSDMLFSSLFAAEEVNREREVIVEEINMYEDNPLMFIGDVFESAIFSDSLLGQPISGPRENVRRFSRREIMAFFRKHYLKGQLTIGVAGNFPEPKIKTLIKKYFGLARGRVVKPSFKKFTARQNRPRVRIQFKETKQVQLALGFPAYRNTDPRLYALSLVAVILGGSMSSRLFMEIREKRSLAYFIKTAVSLYQDTGHLVIQAGLEEAKINQALKTIFDELKKIKQMLVPAEELTKAKEFLKGKLILQLEDSAALISWLAEQQLLTGAIDTLEQKIKKIELVTALEVKRVALNIFNFKKSNLALIGPFKNRQKFLKLLNN